MSNYDWKYVSEHNFNNLKVSFYKFFEYIAYSIRTFIVFIKLKWYFFLFNFLKLCIGFKLLEIMN